MCNQQVTDVMKLYEYPHYEDSNTLRSEVLNDLIGLMYQFKIDLLKWEIKQMTTKGGFTLSSNASENYVTVSFGKNLIIFEGDSIDWVEFDTTRHPTEFFAAILAMIMVKSEAVMVHTCNVN